MPDATSLFSPLQLAAFIGIAAFLISIWKNILGIRAMSKAKPDNADLSNSVTRLQTKIETHDAALTELREACAECKRFQTQELDKIYNRINDVAGQVSHMSGRMEMLVSRKEPRHG